MSKQKHSRKNALNAPRLTPIAAALLLAAALPAQAADGFSELAPLPGYLVSNASSISADGSVIAGVSGGDGAPQATVWTSSGATGLGGTWSFANAVSSDGTTVVGGSRMGMRTHAVRWTLGGGMEDLGVMSLGGESYASGVSADGSVVVGEATYAEALHYWNHHAFRWTSSGGMADLGTLASDPSINTSTAQGVSSNGSVVVGYSDTDSGNTHAFRWTSSDNTMHDLGTLTGGTYSFGQGVSYDGSVVVGYGDDTSGSEHAFRWTSSGGMADLGILSGGSYSQALGVSGNGLVVVGRADDASGNDNAFRWTQSTGMQTVTQWLASAHVTLPSGWTLSYATATNSDGSVVVGSSSTNPSGYDEAWIARVSTLGSGLMTPSNYIPTLAHNGDVPRMGIDLSSLTFFGVHHRPLMDSGLTAGNCAWATADASHSNTYDTDQRLAEAGACRDLGDGRWRAGVGVGVSYSRQGFNYGGEGKYNGHYFYAEADYAPESKRWIGSVSAMFSRWNTTLKRGYLNAGVNDASTGTPDAATWSLRARVDWKNLAQAGGFSVSPFASITHTESHLDAYTETGGGFPAYFNAQSWKSDEVRVGAVLQKPLSAQTDLRFNLEAAGRLDGSGPGVSGQVLGLFAFSYPGANVKSSWVRAMAEVDHRLSDKSLISANINAASSGEDPSWGVSIGYKRAF